MQTLLNAKKLNLKISDFELQCWLPISLPCKEMYEKTRKLQREAETAGRKLSLRIEGNMDKLKYHCKYLFIRSVQKFTLSVRLVRYMEEPL